MTDAPRKARMLSIAPVHGGFGFVVMEEGKRVVDWGVARLYSRNPEEAAVRVDQFMDRYRIGLVLTLDVLSNRRPQAHRLIAAIRSHVKSRGVSDRAVMKAEVHDPFRGRGPTKDAVARIIAKSFPSLRFAGRRRVGRGRHKTNEWHYRCDGCRLGA